MERYLLHIIYTLSFEHIVYPYTFTCPSHLFSYISSNYKEDANIRVIHSILELRGVQVAVSTLPPPRDLEGALQRSRMERKFLLTLISKYWSEQNKVLVLEERIQHLENYVPYHNRLFQNNVGKVTVRINNSQGGIYIKTADLLNVLSSYEFNCGPFSNCPYLQPSYTKQN